MTGPGARLPVLWLRALVAGGTLAAAGAVAGAEWEYFGANTMRAEHYDSRGNLAASPYVFEGGQIYNEFNLNLQRRESEYDVWRAQIYGVFNGSDYRSPFTGFVPERLNLSREKGDAELPHRWEIGDYFGYFSYRTLQRSLKGGTIELQPRVGPLDWVPSIVLITGSQQPNWRALTFEEDYTNGISLLMQVPGGKTRVIGNFLRNDRRSDPTLGTLHRSQDVMSLGAEHATRWGSQLLTFEGEAGAFSGDHDGLTGALSGQNRTGNAYYGQVSGRSASLPLSYRFRAERNDQDYRPNGAVVTPDRRALEAHAGWIFPTGLNLRGRVQAFTDGLQTGNQIDTTTVGANLSGVFLPRYVNGLIGTLDLFRQDVDKRDHTIDNRTLNANLNVTKPLDGGFVGRAGIFVQALHDRVPGAVDVTTYQYSIAVDHLVQLGGFVGTLSPGIVLRFVRGGTRATDDASPTLAFNLANGPHRVGFNYGLLAQEPSLVTPTAPNVYTTQVAADYRYVTGLNTLGVEFNVFDRNPHPLATTTARRVSVFWSHAFEKTAALGRAPLVSDAVGTGAALPRSPAMLLALAPGTDMETQLKRLEESGLRGVRQAGVVVFETRLLDEIDQRQRLAIAHEAGSIAKSALIVELDRVGGAETTGQTFERVRRALLDRFGRPSTTLEEGAFTPTIAADLAAGRFIRVMEWPTENGRVRLGIPRRLDGVVRIEVQHARSFPNPRDTAWSIETVR